MEESSKEGNVLTKEGNVLTIAYRKPSLIDVYLHYDSHLPAIYKVNI